MRGLTLFPALRTCPPVGKYQLATKKNIKRGASSRVTQNKSPASGQIAGQFMNCPVYRPIYKFKRTIERLVDIGTDGINPALYGFNFALSNLNDYQDFTRLFDMYRITKIEVLWLPEYTELTDAALVSNAVNVQFNSSVDISDASPPSSVGELLNYQQVKTTGITKQHSVSWTPTFLMGGFVPCSCWLPTSADSERHYGLKVAIDPTGVAMTFRSKVVFYVECANVQ